MFIILLESLILVFIVYLIFYVICYKMDMDFESVSPYECGFDPSSLTRMSFSYRFFLISILFIIFDVEISLMLPIPFVVKSIEGMWVFNFFMLVLVVGLLYEYYQGALDWMDSV